MEFLLYSSVMGPTNNLWWVLELWCVEIRKYLCHFLTVDRAHSHLPNLLVYIYARDFEVWHSSSTIRCIIWFFFFRKMLTIYTRHWLTIYFRKVLTLFLWEMKKTVKTLIFFFIKTFFNWILNQWPKSTC